MLRWVQMSQVAILAHHMRAANDREWQPASSTGKFYCSCYDAMTSEVHLQHHSPVKVHLNIYRGSAMLGLRSGAKSGHT